MSLKERVYSVLVVSASEKFNAALSVLLPVSQYNPVRVVSDVSSAKRTMAERSFDFVIVNSPLSDGQGIRFAIDASTEKGTVVLLLIKSEIYAGTCDRVTEHGVFILPKPITKTALTLALGWMASARERLRQYEKKTLSVQEKMEEIRVVNRAKWLLVSELKMTEPNAHHYIEKQAMDRCVSKREIAEEIIKTYGC